MAQQASQSVENNFTAGLKTEFTALNFPDNAATDTDNCIYTLIGDVTRRSGIDYEENFTLNTINRTNKALSTYKWNNVGGDGTTQIVISQVGNMLYFYRSSSATVASPLSAQKLAGTIDISTYLVTGSVKDPSQIECQFSDGNGYLFVYHPYCESFYCSYTTGTITATQVMVQIRDFAGLPEPGVAVNYRPPTDSNEHLYNLSNQGWTQGASWTTTSIGTSFITIGNCTFTVPSGLTAANGDVVTLNYAPFPAPFSMAGTVVSYSGTTMVININYLSSLNPNQNVGPWIITPTNHGYIAAWFAGIGNYPSNADVWWNFKDSTDAFNPVTTYTNVSLNSGYAPKGHYLLNAYTQQRTGVSGVPSLTDITTQIRPRTGTWFQGRVWYAGVDDSQAATGDAGYYTWTENIYFSQVVTDPSQFGMCYQLNDPTSEDLFNLLPTDGGVVTIQGCGSIYKLFPIQNGMLVFAANGIWFITGSQGIGFAADDYTVTKISQIQSISSTSFVNVQGLPYFWNEEGIYTVAPAQQGLGLTVNPLTVDSILSFYSDIPIKSKLYVRGDYNPVDYVITFIYRSTEETDLTSRYNFDRALNFNTYNKAFYPYTFEGSPHVHGITYVSNPATTSAPEPVFKYLTSRNGQFTFSEERDENFIDFISADSVGADFDSYFITGYKLRGQATRRFQPQYVYMYSRADGPTSYKIQGLWDFANSGNSGRWSSVQLIQNDDQYSGMIVKRHRIRGQGLALQIKIDSVSGYPFDIMGWAVTEFANAGA